MSKTAVLLCCAVFANSCIARCTSLASWRAWNSLFLLPGRDSSSKHKELQSSLKGAWPVCRAAQITQAVLTRIDHWALLPLPCAWVQGLSWGVGPESWLSHALQVVSSRPKWLGFANSWLRECWLRAQIGLVDSADSEPNWLGQR